MDLTGWIWIGLGVAMMVLELMVPGLVVVFTGMAAVIIGLLRWAGLALDLPTSIAVWMMLSVALVFALRRALVRWLPAESRRDVIDEDIESFDQLVEVVADCDPGSNAGRIRYQGTSWPARALAGTVAAGGKARLIYRDNLDWIIEPAGAPPDAPDVVAARDAARQGAALPTREQPEDE